MIGISLPRNQIFFLKMYTNTLLLKQTVLQSVVLLFCSNTVLHCFTVLTFWVLRPKMKINIPPAYGSSLPCQVLVASPHSLLLINNPPSILDSRVTSEMIIYGSWWLRGNCATTGESKIYTMQLEKKSNKKNPT